MSNIPVKLMDDADRIAAYVEDHPIEIYIDYRDELSDEQVSKIIDGEATEVICQIEDDASMYSTSEELDYYWDEVAEELEISREDVDKWVESDDSFFPGYWLTERDFERLMSNTTTNISAIMWDVDWNFNNWAYGGPVTYSDVKEALRVLGVNPIEFKKLKDENSPQEFRGYFPNIPDREPAVDVASLLDEMIVLYDGVLNFCLGDLAEVKEVVESDSKDITFRKGTNVVMYHYGGGAGIVELPLIRDVTVPRKAVEFANDKSNRYGIQACYGFDQNFWEQGGVHNAK